MQLPIGEGETFKGTIDVVNMKEILYRDEFGITVDINPIDKKHKYWKVMNEARDNLLD